MRRSSPRLYNYEANFLGSLLGPEILLPSQHELLFARCERFTPLQKLMAAVLESALYDLQRYRHARRMREQQFFREAYEWVASQNDKGPFSFVTICQTLGLDPDCLRAGLLTHKKVKKKAI